MHKKFEMNRTEVKGRKVVTHNFKSNSPITKTCEIHSTYLFQKNVKKLHLDPDIELRQKIQGKKNGERP